MRNIDEAFKTIQLALEDVRERETIIKEILAGAVIRIIPYKEMIKMYPDHEVGEAHADYDIQCYVEECRKAYNQKEKEEEQE